MTGRHFDDDPGFDDAAFDSADFDSAAFDDVISLLREGPIELSDEAPSPALWEGIAAELGLAGSAPVAAAATDAATGEPADTGSAAGGTIDDGTVISLASRRPGWGRPAAIVTLAAAVALLLAVPVGLALRSGDDGELVAAAQLDLLEGQDGTPVSAELISVDGDLQIEVDAPTTVGADEFLELWLLEVGDDGVAALESLGRVDGSGRYDVPDDIDLDRFRVVDISVEPDDGDPAHSGVSVVRGEFA